MKKLLTLLLLCLLFEVNVINAQSKNYIPNAGFENLDSCPTGGNQFYLAKPWDTLKNGGGGAPEIFAECGAVGVSIPLGFIQGYQYPRSEKVFMNVGFFATPINGICLECREYIQVKLKDTLIQNKTYCVTFYVNLSNRSKYAIADIGAYFDDGSISTCWYCPAIVNPQVLSPANVYINDTMNWVKIQGSFMATGNESYITLGNFKSDANINKILQYPNSSGDVAEYEVDDVSVIESNSTIKADKDTIINKGDTITLGKSIEGMPVDWYNLQGNLLAASSTINVHPTTTTSYVVKMDLCGNVSYDTVTVNVSTGIEQLMNNNEQIIIYPNPVANQLTISSNQYAVNSIEVTNLLGQQQNVLVEKLTTENCQLKTENLPSGIYFLKATDNKGNVFNAKFVKE